MIHCPRRSVNKKIKAIKIFYVFLRVKLKCYLWIFFIKIFVIKNVIDISIMCLFDPSSTQRCCS